MDDFERWSQNEPEVPPDESPEMDIPDEIAPPVLPPMPDVDDLPPVPAALPRTSRARERHERRKQQKMADAAVPIAPTRQLRPSGGFKLPEIHIPINRLVVYGLAGAIFLMLVIFGIGRFKNEPVQVATNAIWVDKEWSYGNRNDADIAALAQRLRDHRVGTVYVWVGLLQPNNSWTDIAELDKAKSFAKQLRAAYPELAIYGWLSIGSQGADGNNRLGDPTAQQIIADFSKRVVTDLDFDGVMLNIVPVSDGDETYLAALRKVRATIGTDSRMAVAVPPDWTPEEVGVPIPMQIKPGTVWAKEFKQRISLLADQIIVTAYSSGLTAAADYSAWMAYQVAAYAQAAAELESQTEIYMGVPTYEGQPPMHDPAVENVASAVAGVRAGLQLAGAASSLVKGIAIYGEWDTTPQDWEQILSLWVN
jgi:hypothetical protein